ncbi:MULTISPECIES: hypothetical protein [unclassified Streptomyces]|uniref:hypothetical protein n=1 Tax=unclassified Streptomyces TaxID=2593676 RepID=UPI0027809820|nr:hypothetical protein [Streptomyces sp. B4I13]MDQ0961946.1 hypothetical protein [Streptomyces sp. B4I13]
MLAALRGRARALFAGPAAAPTQPGTPALWLEGRVDLADFDDCPLENRRTPHAIRVDGSRCCCCGHETPGRTS